MSEITQERIKEMYEKFTTLGTVAEREETRKDGGIVTKVATMRLDVTVLDVLISSGVAKDENEAQSFISNLIYGELVATATGREEGMDAMYNLLKVGFQIGLFAGRKEGSN